MDGNPGPVQTPPPQAPPADQPTPEQPAGEAPSPQTARTAGNRFEDALEELRTKLAIAEHRRAAEVARTRDAFVRSVEAELHAWDSYLEQLQRRAVVQTGGGRGEVSTSELRLRRNEVARRLGDVRTASDGVWRERRERVLQALDELDHAAGTA
jgi:hypothetical protein